MNYPIYDYRLIKLNNITSNNDITIMRRTNIYKLLFTPNEYIDFDSIDNIEKLLADHMIINNKITNDSFKSYMSDKSIYIDQFIEKISQDQFEKKYLKYKKKYLDKKYKN